MAMQPSTPKADNLQSEVNLTCPLCHDLYVSPQQCIQCKQSFCNFCITSWRAARHSASIISCPICRTDIGDVQQSLTSNHPLDQAAQSSDPLLYSQRKSLIQAELERLRQHIIEPRVLVIGNTHQLRRSPPQFALRRNSDDFASNHNWKLFVELHHPNGSIDHHADRFIERVLVRLHPTFNPSLLALSSPPFEIHRVGWGRFSVHIMVTFKSVWRRDPMMLEWMLDFSSSLNSRSINIQFERQPTDFFQIRAGEEGEQGDGEVGGDDTTTITATDSRQQQQEEGDGGGGIDRNNNTVSTPRHQQQVQDWRTMLLQAVNTPSDDDEEEDEDWEPPEWDGNDVDMEMIEFNDFLNAIGEEEDDG